MLLIKHVVHVKYLMIALSPTDSVWNTRIVIDQNQYPAKHK